MQRELISIPKMLLYALVTVLVYVIQTSVFGAHPLFGYHVDLLPAAVTAAALLDGSFSVILLHIVPPLIHTPAASSLPSDPAKPGNYVVRNVRLKKNTVKSINMMLYARNPTMPMML